MKPRTTRPTNRELTALGISAAHASDLANGKKLPSLMLAQRIEAATGYPANAWRLERAA